MATWAQAPMQRSAGVPTPITRALVDELRTILDRRGVRQTHSLVADFVARHRLTHRDVDALLVALTRVGVADVPATATSPIVDGATVGDLGDQDVHAVPLPLAAPEVSEQPGGAADEAAPDDDFAWMFGEEPEIPARRSADEVVDAVLDDLLGDWSRTGGRLTRAEVALLATKRKLSPTQLGELLDLLEEAGVELPESAEPLPGRAARKGYEFHGDSVGQYLRTIARYPLIDGPREVELWSLISQGVAAQEELDAAEQGELAPNVQRSLRARAADGRRAHAELVCANLRLVVSIAKARHYESSGIEFADRIQDGNLGLMRAADKFDGSKGFKFSTYATNWIRQFIERGIGDRGRTVRIPVHVHEQVQKVRRAVSKLTARLDREPTLAEIADLTGVEPGRVQAFLDLMHPFRSLDALLGDEGDLHLSDVLVREEDRDGRTDPAQIVIHAMFHADTKRMLTALLPERSVRILERRFGLGTGEKETLDDIATDYNVTRERIRQIQDKSLVKLQESEQAAALRSYLVDDSKAGRSGGFVGRQGS
ncbi:sigma-70 family RNA polymerase sigma factor [Micromonospora sp. NPDC049230]|uniref:sigma-70 family RNA polymerase sigma factor n=1 Tax=Micromonospora sp. NPDC049230 TaxID=3155502 RepID=UPI0033E5032D